MNNMDETKREYNGVPEQYWPRCDWCGGHLGDGNAEYKISQDLKRTICPACHELIISIIQCEAPHIISQALAKKADEPVFRLSYTGLNEITEEAQKAMAEAQILG